ncbi:MAG: N-acetylmuramoyl-L-alanine amidase [Planctomycetes bacterium]|nr:N-acetylmuramoyl-L-alanine amidase [Planctomycetota bacterium]
MRYLLITLAGLVLFAAGCTSIAPIPPQDPVIYGPEPRSMMLSEMTIELGWTYEPGPGAYDFTMSSPKGDKVIFKAESDIVNINGTQWRQERDSVDRRNDMLLPESTFNFVCKHFGRYDLVHEPRRDPIGDYDLEPIGPTVQPEKTSQVDATSTALKGLTICIDAGHGGSDPGGIGHGVQEKQVTLPVALKLRDLCKAASAKVIMTRENDTYPDLDQRCELANSSRADLFISIHANISPTDESVTGFEVFYNKNSQPGALFAKAITSAMDAATNSPNRGAKQDPRGLRVLEKTKMTAVLVELGFLSNDTEAKELTEKAYQDKMAKALFEGVVQTWTKGRASVSK